MKNSKTFEDMDKNNKTKEIYTNEWNEIDLYNIVKKYPINIESTVFKDENTKLIPLYIHEGYVIYGTNIMLGVDYHEKYKNIKHLAINKAEYSFIKRNKETITYFYNDEFNLLKLCNMDKEIIYELEISDKNYSDNYKNLKDKLSINGKYLGELNNSNVLKSIVKWEKDNLKILASFSSKLKINYVSIKCKNNILSISYPDIDDLQVIYREDEKKQFKDLFNDVIINEKCNFEEDFEISLRVADVKRFYKILKDEKIKVYKMNDMFSIIHLMDKTEKNEAYFIHYVLDK